MSTLAEAVVARADDANLPDFLPNAIRDAQRIHIDNVAPIAFNEAWTPDVRDLPNLLPQQGLNWYEYRVHPALVDQISAPRLEEVGYLFSTAPYGNSWLSIAHCLTRERGADPELAGIIELEVDSSGRFGRWWIDSQRSMELAVQSLVYPVLLARTLRNSPKVSLDQPAGDGWRVRRRGRIGAVALSCRELWIEPVLRTLRQTLHHRLDLAEALRAAEAEFSGTPRPFAVPDRARETTPPLERTPTSPRLDRPLASRVGNSSVLAF